MSTLTQLQQNRRIIQEFTASTLAEIPGPFARLAYLADLRNVDGGRYEHAGLAALYEDEAVHQSLQLCHEQVFEKILETPLAGQETELRAYLESLGGEPCDRVQHWIQTKTYRALMPESLPEYLKQLFCSNLHALLEILHAKCYKAHSGA